MAGEASPAAAAVATSPAGCLSSNNSSASKESSPVQQHQHQQLNSSVDSGIAVLETETPTLRRRQRLQQCHRILQVLQRDHLNHQQLRDRLSKLANKKWKKEETIEDHSCNVCNVCCADLDLSSAKNYVTCRTCGKSVCRGLKCADWRPKDASWECQLCQSSKESLAHTSSWVAEQMSFNQHKFVYPRARSEVYIPILGDGNDSSMQFESVSQIGLPSNSEDRAKIREYVEEIVAEMLGGNLDHIKVGQLSKSENYLLLFDKFHAKLSNLLINVENSLCARSLQGDLPAIVNGHLNGSGNSNNNLNNNNNNNGDSELADISQTRLRSLIETIIAETLRSSSLSASGAVSEISLDTRSQLGATELANGNGMKRRHRTEHYFEPKIYQDLLATAVLNKIADKEGNTRLLAESSPDLSGRHIDENFNAEALSTTSGSSIEPRSDCSLTDHEIVLDNGKSQTLQPDLERESVLSDYIAAHMVPLPDFSASVTESEDDIGSISSSMIGDGNWEDNWLFKKKRSSVTPSTTGMLVPAPKENIRAQIGDKTADEVSDLSEMGSDAEDSSLDLLRGNDLNDRLLSKHLIGGQNTKLVLDELVDRTSLTSHTLPEEHEPAFTETSNAFVVSPPAVPAVPPPPMVFQDDSLNEELEHTPIAAQGETEELASLDGCTGFSTVEYLDEEQMHENVPSVIEILAAMALGPMLAVPASEQPGAMTPSEMHTLKELSDLALAEINSRTMDLAHHYSLDIIEEENTDLGETAQLSMLEVLSEFNSPAVELPASVEASAESGAVHSVNPPEPVTDDPQLKENPSTHFLPDTPLDGVGSSDALQGAPDIAPEETISQAELLAVEPASPLEALSDVGPPAVEVVSETQSVNSDYVAPLGVLPYTEPPASVEIHPVELLPETQPTDLEHTAFIEVTEPQSTQKTIAVETVAPVEVVSKTQTVIIEPASPLEVLPDVEPPAPLEVLPEPLSSPAETDETISHAELVAGETIDPVEVISETQTIDIEHPTPIETLSDLEPTTSVGILLDPPAPVEVDLETQPTDLEPVAPEEVLPQTQPTNPEPVAPMEVFTETQPTNPEPPVSVEVLTATQSIDPEPPAPVEVLPETQPTDPEPIAPDEVLPDSEPQTPEEVLPETQPTNPEPPMPVEVLPETQPTNPEPQASEEVLPETQPTNPEPPVPVEVLPDPEPPAPVEVLPDSEPQAPVEVLPDSEPQAPEEVLPETQPTDPEPPAPVEVLSKPESIALVEVLPKTQSTDPEPPAPVEVLPDSKPQAPVEVLPETQPTDPEPPAPVEVLPDSKPPAPLEVLPDSEPQAPEEVLPETQPTDPEPPAPVEVLPDPESIALVEVLPDTGSPAPVEVLPDPEIPARVEVLPDPEPPAPVEVLPDSEPQAPEEVLPETQPTDPEPPAPAEVLPDPESIALVEVLPDTGSPAPVEVLPDPEIPARVEVLPDPEPPAPAEDLPETQSTNPEPSVPVEDLPETQPTDPEHPAPEEVIPDSKPQVPVEVLPDSEPQAPAEVLPDTQPTDPEPPAPEEVLPDSEPPAPVEVLPDSEPPAPVEVLPDSEPQAPEEVLPETQPTDPAPPAPVEVLSDPKPQALEQDLPETQPTDPEPPAPVEVLPDSEPPAPVEVLPDSEPQAPEEVLPETQPTDPAPPAPVEVLSDPKPQALEQDLPETQPTDPEPPAPVEVLPDSEPPAPVEVLPDSEPPAPVEVLPDSEPQAPEEVLPETQPTDPEPPAPVEVLPDSEPPAPVEVLSDPKPQALEQDLPETQPKDPEPPAPVEVLPDSEPPAPVEVLSDPKPQALEQDLPETQPTDPEPPAPVEVLPDPESIALVEVLPDTGSPAPVEVLPDPEIPAPVEVLPDSEPPAPVEVLPNSEPPAPVEVLPDSEPQAPEEVLPETQPTDPEPPALVEVLPDPEPQAPEEVLPDSEPQATEDVLPETQHTKPESPASEEVLPESQPTDSEPPAPVEVLPDPKPLAPVEVLPDSKPQAPVEVLPDSDPQAAEEVLPETQPTDPEPPAPVEVLPETQSTDTEPPAPVEVLPDSEPQATEDVLPETQPTKPEPPAPEEVLSETQPTDSEPPAPVEVIPNLEPQATEDVLPETQPTKPDPPAPLEVLSDSEPQGPVEVLPDTKPPAPVEVLPETQSTDPEPPAPVDVLPDLESQAPEEVIPETLPTDPEPVAPEEVLSDSEPQGPVEVLPDTKPPAPVEVLPDPEPLAPVECLPETQSTDVDLAATGESIPQEELVSVEAVAPVEVFSEAQSTDVRPEAADEAIPEAHSIDVVPVTTEEALPQADVAAVEPFNPVEVLPETQTVELKPSQSMDEEDEFVDAVSETRSLDVGPVELTEPVAEKSQLVSMYESAVEPEEIVQQMAPEPPVEAVPEAQSIAVTVEAQALQELVPETLLTALEQPERESVVVETVPETQTIEVDSNLLPSEPPKSISSQELPEKSTTEPEIPVVDHVPEGNASIDSGKPSQKCLRRQPHITDTPPRDGSPPVKSESLNLLGTICKFYIKDKRLLATIERRRRRSLIMHKYLSSFDSMDDSLDDETHPSIFEELNEDSLASTSELKPPTERVATPTSEVDPLDTSETEPDLVDEVKVEADEPQCFLSPDNLSETNLIYNLDSKANALEIEEPLVDKDDKLESHLNHLEDDVTESDCSAATSRLDMASQTSCDMPDEQDVETDSLIVFSLSDITYNFINEILFSDQLSTESHCSDDSEPSTACETFNGDGDTEQEFVSQRVLVLDSLNTNSNNTLHANLQLPLTQTNTVTPLGGRRTNGKLTNGSLRWSGGYTAEPVAAQPDVDDDDVVLLRRFVPGSIAEREVKKWYNAVEMPNNPYAPEALKQRISGTQERYMDVPNISPSAEQKALATALTENPDPPSPQTDYKRYSRDYYINNAPNDSTGNGRTPASNPRDLEDPEDIVINEAQKASQPQQESVYKALPVQVLDESLDSQSLHSLQTTTTTSDESDTVRIYDFNKQETTVIRAAPATEQHPSSSTTSSMESAQDASPSVSSLDSSVPKKRERPVVLQFGPGDTAPTVGSPVTTPTRGSTPPAFRFLQPKRRLIDPSQVLSVDEDDVPEPPTPVAERPVIEVEVGHAMPSVKALAQAFLLTSKRTQPQRRWRQVRISAPPGTPNTPGTSLPKRHRLEHAVSMAEVADESTIASDLSSLETDPSSSSDGYPPIATPESPVPSGFLRSNIAFFENLKFK